MCCEVKSIFFVVCECTPWQPLNNNLEYIFGKLEQWCKWTTGVTCCSCYGIVQLNSSQIQNENCWYQLEWISHLLRSLKFYDFPIVWSFFFLLCTFFIFATFLKFPDIHVTVKWNHIETTNRPFGWRPIQCDENHKFAMLHFVSLCRLSEFCAIEEQTSLIVRNSVISFPIRNQIKSTPIWYDHCLVTRCHRMQPALCGVKSKRK